MNPLDLLLRVGPAIQAIFELGYEPTEDLFFELTPDQYQQLEREGKDISKRWFTIIPKNPKHDIPEVLIVDEHEAKALLDAARYINSFCKNEGKGRKFASYDEKLEFAASQLPSVFSQSSKYGRKAPHLKVIK